MESHHMGVGNPLCTTVALNGEGMYFTLRYALVQPVLQHRHPDPPPKALSISDPKLAAFKKVQLVFCSFPPPLHCSPTHFKPRNTAEN